MIIKKKEENDEKERKTKKYNKANNNKSHQNAYNRRKNIFFNAFFQLSLRPSLNNKAALNRVPPKSAA